MTRLRKVTPSGKGWTRRRAGRGFSYLDHDGKKLPKEEVQRIKSLAIPPAWEDVWICPAANGHIQAVGTDDAGRRQYLYHPQWREQRDALKFDRVLAASDQLPAARRRITRDLRQEGMPLTRACAAAVRLLDLGYFRIGSDVYAEAHGSFGLTTLEREHVSVAAEGLRFEFMGKSGVEQDLTISDDDITDALQVMRRRRDGTTRLMAWQDAERTWHPLHAKDVNDYLAEVLGEEVTAKDFRTWHATVHAAVALAASNEPGDTKASQQRAIKEAVTDVSESLGNTPTIAKNSYIDPRIIEAYQEGTTIDIPGAKPGRNTHKRQHAVENAVRDVLRD